MGNKIQHPTPVWKVIQSGRQLMSTCCV